MFYIFPLPLLRDYYTFFFLSFSHSSHSALLIYISRYIFVEIYDCDTTRKHCLYTRSLGVFELNNITLTRTYRIHTHTHICRTIYLYIMFWCIVVVVCHDRILVGRDEKSLPIHHTGARFFIYCLYSVYRYDDGQLTPRIDARRKYRKNRGEKNGIPNRMCAFVRLASKDSDLFF